MYWVLLILAGILPWGDSFALEIDSHSCPRLAAKDFCKLSSAPIYRTASAGKATQKLMRKACLSTSEEQFKGIRRGFARECSYRIPSNWPSPLHRAVSRLTIRAKTKVKSARCPLLSYKHFHAIMKGHSHEDVIGILWKKKNVSHDMSNKSENLQSDRGQSIHAYKAKEFLFCVYSMNNLPIVLYHKFLP